MSANDSTHMIAKGFLFGMMLQLAVGPVCLYVFRVSAESGVLGGFAAVAAVCIVDAVYIICAILGVTGWSTRRTFRGLFRYIGPMILIVFALDIIASIAGVSFIPHPNFMSASRVSGPFLSAFVLTASNPLTILFWAGVFSDRIVRVKNSSRQVILFSAGCVLATLVFMGIVALAGSCAGVFLPEIVLKIMSVVVACALLFFAIRMISRK
jgi:threonine/homoserine/homoserine lactone efflux protein